MSSSRGAKQKGILERWLYNRIQEELDSALSYFTIETTATFTRYYFDDISQTLCISIRRGVTEPCAVQIVEAEYCDTDRICLVVADSRDYIYAHLAPERAPAVPDSWRQTNGRIDLSKLPGANVNIRTFELIVDLKADDHRNLWIVVSGLESLGHCKLVDQLDPEDLQHVADHSRIHNSLRTLPTVRARNLYPELNSQPPSSLRRNNPAVLRRDTPSKAMAQPIRSPSPPASQEHIIERDKRTNNQDDGNKALNSKAGASHPTFESPDPGEHDTDDQNDLFKSQMVLPGGDTSFNQTQFATQVAIEPRAQPPVHESLRRTHNIGKQDRVSTLLDLLNPKAVPKLKDDLPNAKSSATTRANGEPTDQEELAQESSHSAQRIVENLQTNSFEPPIDLGCNGNNESNQAQNHTPPNEAASIHTLPHQPTEVCTIMETELPCNDEAVGSASIRPVSLETSKRPSIAEVEDVMNNDMSNWTSGLRMTRRFFRIPSDQRKVLHQASSWLPSEPGLKFPPANIPAAVLQKLMAKVITRASPKTQHAKPTDEQASPCTEDSKDNSRSEKVGTSPKTTAVKSRARSPSPVEYSMNDSEDEHGDNSDDYHDDDGDDVEEEEEEEEEGAADDEANLPWGSSPARSVRDQLPPDSSLAKDTSHTPDPGSPQPMMQLGDENPGAEVEVCNDEETIDGMELDSAERQTDFPSSPPVVALSSPRSSRDRPAATSVVTTINTDATPPSGESSIRLNEEGLGPTPPEQQVQVAVTPIARITEHSRLDVGSLPGSSTPMQRPVEMSGSAIVVPSTYQGDYMQPKTSQTTSRESRHALNDTQISPSKRLRMLPKSPNIDSRKRAAEQSPKSAKRQVKHRRLKTTFDFGDESDITELHAIAGKPRTSSAAALSKLEYKQRTSDQGPDRSNLAKSVQERHHRVSLPSTQREKGTNDKATPAGKIRDNEIDLPRSSAKVSPAEQTRLQQRQPVAFAHDSQKSDTGMIGMSTADIRRTTFTSSAPQRQISTPKSATKIPALDAKKHPSVPPLESRNAFAAPTSSASSTGEKEGVQPTQQRNNVSRSWHQDRNTPFKEFMHSYVSLKSFRGALGHSDGVGEPIRLPETKRRGKVIKPEDPE